MADNAGHGAAGFPGEVGCQLLLLFLEFIEANLDEFVRVKRLGCGLRHRSGHALLAHDHHGVEVVR